jgi:hypothetical protein
MSEYTNARYLKYPNTDHVSEIIVDINGVTSTVPIDPANTDYANMMALVTAGELVIAPAGSQE